MNNFTQQQQYQYSSSNNNNNNNYNNANDNNNPLTPRRLELSLNPEDGSLLTSPLLSVLLAATDGLYSDLYNMAHGEMEVTSAQPAQAEGEDNEAAEEKEQMEVSQRKERMSNLSFAQRRHELAWRLAQHGKSLTHVAALTAAAASSNLASATQISTRALQHARTAWVQADEAQDALYFFHAQLFPARQAPHDVYGALDTYISKQWVDLPTDIQLIVDRYESSQEKTWSKQETASRWNMSVRDKLLRGEVGWMKQNNIHVLWDVSLRGGIVRVTHGKPKNIGNNVILYPFEAIVSVLSTASPAEWTLLSINVHAQAKTGESNHQLDTSNRQRYDLHRLCALAMNKEEARFRERKSNNNNDNGNKQSETTTEVPRPLHSMFQLAHMFGLSWQLEILSAQALALRRGAWGSGSNRIVVTPVEFRDHQQNQQQQQTQQKQKQKPVAASPTSKSSSTTTASTSKDAATTTGTNANNAKVMQDPQVLGMVSISFWSVDDRYGPPSMGDLSYETDNTSFTTTNSSEHDTNDNSLDAMDVDTTATTAKPKKIKSAVTNQLTLTVRAELDVGIRVSLSGADSVMALAKQQPHLRATIADLVKATSNPFALSASAALLAATQLCAERKCHAIVDALRSSNVLPSWMTLVVERESIAVGAQISYHGIIDNDKVVQQGKNDNDNTTTMENASTNNNNNKDAASASTSSPVVLFRITCDSRTGSFTPTFSRSTLLLRRLACNDWKANESTALRILSLASHRRRRAPIDRSVRDAFDGLTRSINVLGERVGVGESSWDNDNDTMSASLRERAVKLACADAKISLMTCCGMSSLYGLSALAIGVSTGVTANANMAGGPIDNKDKIIINKNDNTIKLLQAPPISFLLHQELIEKSSITNDGEKKKQAHAQQELFAISCAVYEHALTLYPFEISVQLESPSAVPIRTCCELTTFRDSIENNEELLTIDNRASKRIKTQDNSTTILPQQQQQQQQSRGLMEEVERFAGILTATLDDTLD